MKTKKCSKCRVTKDWSEFHQKSTENRVCSWCKNCVHIRQRRRWIDRKIKAVNLFGGKCVKCGYDQNLAALEFHHVDQKSKEYIWSELKKRPWQEVVNELQKCTLVCGNCHMELHNPQLDKSALQYESMDNTCLTLKKAEIIPTGQCVTCKTDVYGTIYCSTKCSSKDRRKVKRPSKVTLSKKISTTSWCAIGREYGVSDNAVRKWAKKYGLLPCNSV